MDKKECQQGKKRKRERKKHGEQEQEGAPDIKSVMFCPYTKNGELAKQLRNEEEKLQELTGYKIKIVEQVGDKLIDRPIGFKMI